MPYRVPTQSQFIPTYSPMPIEAIARGGQQLEAQQQAGIEQYDAVNQTLNELSSQFLEEDKQIIDQYREKFTNETEQMLDTNNFIQAAPKLRRIARDINQEITSGEGAIAISNFQQMTDNVKRLRESDNPVHVIAGIENKMLREYKGVKEGSKINRIHVPEYYDIDERARELAKQIKPDVLKQANWQRNPDGTYSRIGMQDKVKRESLPREVIENIVFPQLQNDPKAMEYLQFEAEALDKDVSQHMAERVEMAAKMAGDTYSFYKDGDISKEEVDLGSGTAQGFVAAPGVLQANSFTQSLRDDIDEIKVARRRTDDDQAKNLEATKLGGIKTTMAQMVQDGQLSTQEFNDFLNTLEENDYNLGTPANPIPNTVAGRMTPTRRIQAEGPMADPKFRDIYNKIDKYINEAGDIVSHSLILTDKRTRDHFFDTFKNIPERAFSIINFDGKKEEELQTIAKLKQKGTGFNVGYTDDRVFFEVQMLNEKTDEYERHILQEEVIPGHASPIPGITNLVANTIGGVEGRKLNNVHNLRGIPAMSGANLIEHNIPQQYTQADQKWLSIEPDPANNGVNLIVGTSQENNQPYTYAKRLVDMSPRKSDQSTKPRFPAFMNDIYEVREKFGIFNDRDIAEIMANGQLTARTLAKVQNDPELQQAYPFKDHIEALTFNGRGIEN